MFPVGRIYGPGVSPTSNLSGMRLITIPTALGGGALYPLCLAPNVDCRASSHSDSERSQAVKKTELKFGIDRILLSSPTSSTSSADDDADAKETNQSESPTRLSKPDRPVPLRPELRYPHPLAPTVVYPPGPSLYPLPCGESLAPPGTDPRSLPLHPEPAAALRNPFLSAHYHGYPLFSGAAHHRTESSSPSKRKRTWSRAVFSALQRKGLEKRFDVQKYVTKPDRRQLAAMLGLTDAQVKVWFQNRRMKWRHQMEAQKKSEDKKRRERRNSSHGEEEVMRENASVRCGVEVEEEEEEEEEVTDEGR